MSAILEALERSEKERNQGAVPRLGDAPVLDESRPIRWVVLTLLAVMAVSMTVVLILLMMNGVGRGNGPTTAAALEAARELPKVSVISYAEEPSQRFAMVANQLVREGDAIDAQTTMVAIHRDRVDLDIDGRRVTLKP